MTVSRETEKDRAAEDTVLYRKKLAEAVTQAGGPTAGRLITRAKEAEANFSWWEGRGHGWAYLVTPQQGFETKTLFTGLGEIAPNTVTKRHRHMNEAVIYVLEGAGYVEIEDQLIEWESGDTFFVPNWVWHRFGNPHDRRVRYIATINRPLMDALGLWKIEDAPED